MPPVCTLSGNAHNLVPDSTGLKAKTKILIHNAIVNIQHLGSRSAKLPYWQSQSGELNPGPLPYHGSALPLSYFGFFRLGLAGAFAGTLCCRYYEQGANFFFIEQCPGFLTPHHVGGHCPGSLFPDQLNDERVNSHHSKDQDRIRILNVKKSSRIPEKKLERATRLEPATLSLEG